MRVRLTRRSRRVAIGGLSLLMVPIGVAHLAQNSVATSYVGESVGQGSIGSTTIMDDRDAHIDVSQAEHKGYYLFNDLKAYLTDSSGAGVDDEPIVFSAEGVTICTGTTQATTKGKHGLATCNGRIAVGSFTTLPSTFVATFAGDPPLASSQSSEGTLKVIGPAD